MWEPSMVIGHAVRSPSLVAVGGAGKWMAYGCSNDMVVVCALKEESQEQHAVQDEDFVGAMRIISLNAGESLSVLALHPTKELFCLGTAHHGIYLTTVSNPILSDTTTRLPVRLTGENVFSSCFLVGHESKPDVVVVSCGFQELAKERFRLSLWDVHTRSLLWRGCADALDVIVPLPGTFGFASCTQREVTLWTVQTQGQSEAKGSGNKSTGSSSKENTKNEENGSKGYTVLNKPCSVVNELRDSEFVAIVPPRGNEDTLTVLTTVGFLVSFDCRSGTAVKWMDCKVCPATAAYRMADDIVVCGSMVRFFSSDKWEFHGKIKQHAPPAMTSSSLMTRLMDSLCTGAAVCGKSRVFLFFSGGDMSRYRVQSPKNGAAKLTFHNVYQYNPVCSDEAPLRWIPLTTDTLCLWSPQRLRVYNTKLWNISSMSLETTCIAYHDSLGVLLVYDSSAYEIVAIAPNLKRELCRLSVAEPLTSLLVFEKNQFVCLSLDNSLLYFSGQWKDDGEFVLKALRSTRLVGFKAPLTHLVSVKAGGLFAASTHVVANLDTGEKLNVSDDIISVVSAGNMLLVVHRHCCVVLDSSTMQRVGETLQTSALEEAVSSPKGDVVALRSGTELTVVSVKNRESLAHLSFDQEANESSFVNIISAGFTTDGSCLLLCDSRGLFSMHRLKNIEADVKHLPRQERVHSSGGITSRRSLSYGGPTNNELQSRFKDLHGFYETTRHTHKEREEGLRRSNSATCVSPRRDTATAATSSSGVLMPTQGDSILQIPSASTSQQLPFLRKWETDPTPTELPQVVSTIESPGVGVSNSVVEVSALTSMESAMDFNMHTVAESQATMTPSIAADLFAKEREKVTFADTPANGVRSPPRKGQPSMSPPGTPEDDVVNVDSIENEELRKQLHYDPLNLPAVPTKSMSVVSNASASVKARSCELRDALRELAEAYEQRGDEDSVDVADTIDSEAVEEMFNTVSRMYARIQSRNPRRPGSMGSVAGSDTSTASFNVILADLQRLQRQNCRIEAQNEEILTRLGLK